MQQQDLSLNNQFRMKKIQLNGHLNQQPIAASEPTSP